MAVEFEESGAVEIWALAKPMEKANAAHSRVACFKKVRQRTEVISVPRKNWSSCMGEIKQSQ
jgi:hypothetical protein